MTRSLNISAEPIGSASPGLSIAVRTMAATALLLAATALAPTSALAAEAEAPTARLEVGRPAPDFTLESSDGGSFQLSEMKDRKSLVLIFFRGTW